MDNWFFFAFLEMIQCQTCGSKQISLNELKVYFIVTYLVSPPFLIPSLFPSSYFISSPPLPLTRLWVLFVFMGAGGGYVQYLVTLLNVLFFFCFSHFVIPCLQFQRHSGGVSASMTPVTSHQSPALDLCGFCPVTSCSVLHGAAVVYNNTNEVCHAR